MQVSSSDVVEVGELLQPRLQKVILVKLDYFHRHASALHANYATRHTLRGRSSGHGSQPLDIAQGKDLFPKDDTKANLRTLDDEARTHYRGHHKKTAEHQKHSNGHPPENHRIIRTNSIVGRKRD